MSSKKYSENNKNADSENPLIAKNTNHANHVYNNVPGSSNGSSNTPNSGGNSSSDDHKQTKQEFEAASLERTVAKLKNYLFALFAVCVAGWVITLVVVSVLYVRLHHELAHHEHVPKVAEVMGEMLKDDELCVPCDKLLLGPSRMEQALLNKFIKKESESIPGQHQCCVDTSERLMDMLTMFIEKRFREEAAKGFPGAHLPGQPITVRPAGGEVPMGNLQMMGQAQDYVEEAGRLYNIEQWSHNQHLAFVINGVRYREGAGRLVVPEDGYYYVYSHVAFLDLDPKSTSTRVLSQYLYRYNEAYRGSRQERLSQNSVTLTTGQAGGAREYFSQVAGVFKLRKEDEIFVKVSNLTLLNQDPMQGSFGLFQITRTQSVIRSNTTKS